RGLLAGLESEAEFAFVMGHEIGHVSARHTASRLSYRMIQAVGLAAAGTALADEEYGRGVLALGAAGSTLLLLKYSRDDELEADRLGVEYMAEVGYRPENAALAHKNLEKAVTSYMESIGTDPRRRSFFEELLSTHPRTSVRIDEIEEMTGGVEPGPLRGDGTRSERFTEMTAGLREANRVYREHYDPAVTAYGEGDFDRAEVLVGRAISEDPGQAPFFALKGYIALERKEYAEAEPLFREALSLHSGYQPALRGAGIQAYFAEEYAGAVQVLTRALEILPGDLSARFYLGMSHMKDGRYSGAVEHLGAYAEAKPKDPKVHYYLGYSYEKAGKPREAYTEYIRQLQVEPDNEEGRLALERAREIELPAERPEVMPWEKDRLR
ncbi:MAG TPA: M48 family metalloprotease, partial [Gammaproteobacteria bacterium]|nr:M48 family metalloprotease [Gammaproteobacteria bacterium]